MKIRNGFVSNSSSSSFIINKKCLTKEQIDQICNYKEVARVLGNYDSLELSDWQKKYNEDIASGKTPNNYPFLQVNICGKFGYLDDFWTIDECFWEIRG